MGEKKVFKYPVIIEKAKNNYSAYSPDLPGCIAAGQTVEETLEHMKEAIQFHIEGLKQEGIQIPKPSIQITYIEIAI
jgi:predicted RNase H-like HicB family nuclease